MKKVPELPPGPLLLNPAFGQSKKPTPLGALYFDDFRLPAGVMFVYQPSPESA
jgi:hypothetical protein